MKYMLRFISGFLVLVLLLAVPFRTVSAADAMPTTETEGIVDGGLYQIRNAAVVYECLVYHVMFIAVSTWGYSDKSEPAYGKDQSSKFRVTYMGDGTYTISPMGWRTARLQADGNELTVALPNDSPEQRWYIIPCEGGYEIRSAAGNHLAIGRFGSLSGAVENRVWNFEPMPEMEETGNSIYVYAPAHWRPALGVSFAEGCAWYNEVVMDPGQDGWYSFPNPNVEETFRIHNAYFRNGEQVAPPDINIRDVKIEPGKDCWIVIHDDPNVDGDLSVSVYYSKPENLPETADSAALAPAAAALIVSALALLMSVKLKPKEL